METDLTYCLLISKGGLGRAADRTDLCHTDRRPGRLRISSAGACFPCIAFSGESQGEKEAQFGAV